MTASLSGRASLLIAALGSVLAAAPGAKTDGVVECVVAPAGLNNQRNSEGTLLIRRDGSLLLAWADYYSEDGSDWGAARVSAKISKDGGRAWGPRFTLQENFSRMNVGQPDLLRLRSGKVLFFCPVCNSLEDLYPMLKTSSDDGRTFSEPKPLPIDPSPSYTGFNNDRGIQLGSGRILLPCWFTKDYALEHRIRSRIYYSDDDGATWKKSAIIDIKESVKRGADEPGVVELGDGRVMMWLRTDLGSIYRCYSSDQGLTWSVPESMGLMDPNSPQSMKRIPSTGDLLLVWNKSRTTRFPLSMAVSKDDGKTWKQIRNLDGEPGHGYGYTSIEFVDNRVLFTYYDAQKLPNDHSSTEMYPGLAALSLKFKSVPVSWLYE